MAAALKSGLRGLALLACLGNAQTTDFDATVVNQRLAQLERLISAQTETIHKQEEELQEHEALLAAGVPFRKLQDAEELPPSIYGDQDTTRAYTREEEIGLALDHIWLITCGALVMFMQAGFALVESGCCRAKNVQNILLKNLTDVAVGTLGWWFSGWAFAYSGPYEDGVKPNEFLGYESFFGTGFLQTRADGQFEPSTTPLNWFFQWAFCSAAATIVSGGVAERVNFPGYCIFSFVMTSFIYPVVVGWTWGYGWLGARNYFDFAGSGIVHMAGGVGALVGAICAGPRSGRWSNPDAFVPHSLPLIVLGTFVLWFGWYGFNCGSTLQLHTAAKAFMAAQVAMNTTIAAATGGLTVFLLRLIQLKKYDIGGFCNGILAGLVSITAGCGNVECGSAFGIALCGGIIYEVTSILMKKVGVDDPVDAFAVHGACGAWGTFSAAMFDWGTGVDHYHAWSGFNCNVDDDGNCATGANGAGIGINIAGIFAIAAWVAFFTALIFVPLRVMGALRASEEVQEEGFDAAKHSPPKAYVQYEGSSSSNVKIIA